MNREGAEREGDTESEAGSRLSCQHTGRRRAQAPERGFMTRAEVGRLPDETTQVPWHLHIQMKAAVGREFPPSLVSKFKNQKETVKIPWSLPLV